MGPQHSLTQPHPQPQPQPINHPKFNKAKFLNNFQLMKIQLPLPTIKHFTKWQNLYSQLDFYENQYLLLPRTCSFVKNSLCGDAGLVEIQYENFHYLLRDQIDNRKAGRQYLEESQLWYLFYGLVIAACSFRKIQSKVGDIRPNNIFLNDIGQVKIANRCSWPQQRTNYEKTLFQQQLTYLAPEEIQSLRTSNQISESDPYLCEAFSIGLTMLETALLDQSNSLYRVDFKNLKGAKFEDRRLFEKLMRLWNLGYQGVNSGNIAVDNVGNNNCKYSWQLKIAISALCELNPKDRATTDHLYKWLQPHQTQITNMQPFQTALQLPEFHNINKYLNIMKKVQRGQYNQKTNTISSSSIHRLHARGSSSASRENMKLNNNSYVNVHAGNVGNVGNVGSSGGNSVNNKEVKFVYNQRNIGFNQFGGVGNRNLGYGSNDVPTYVHNYSKNSQSYPHNTYNTYNTYTFPDIPNPPTNYQSQLHSHPASSNNKLLQNSTQPQPQPHNHNHNHNNISPPKQHPNNKPVNWSTPINFTFSEFSTIKEVPRISFSSNMKKDQFINFEQLRINKEEGKKLEGFQVSNFDDRQ